MIPGEIFTSFAEFQGIVSVNDFLVSSRVPGTSASFSGFLVKSFCTDTPGSIDWLDPSPRLHIDDCFETRNCRLLSARGTASPFRLLHGALVILVRLQISQFRSLGKWVWTLCLPKSSRLFVVDSKEASWEELAWEPPCNGISSSTKFSLNSCSHSGISGSSHRFLRSIVISFRLILGNFVGLVFHRFTRTFPFSNRHFAYCRWKGEDDADDSPVS